MEIGEKYNRLTVVSFSHRDKGWRKFYNYICDCGKEVVVNGSLVKRGNTKSCGCYKKELCLNRRVFNNHSEITAIILGYKRHAERRNIDWFLSREEVEFLIKQNCFYCDDVPRNRKKIKKSLSDDLLYSGIDRKDNIKGYIIDNCVPCCKICNNAKSDLSLEDFTSWCVRIANKQLKNE